jgi:lipoate-protein ligase A
MKKVLATFLFIISTSAACSEDEAKKNTQELAAAIQDHMITTYICQHYIGGLVMYRSAKLTFESILMKMGIDRNKAVLLLNEAEEKIKQVAPDQMKKLEEMPAYVTREDKRNVCIQMIFEKDDMVKLLQAKLGLL